VIDDGNTGDNSTASGSAAATANTSLDSVTVSSSCSGASFTAAASMSSSSHSLSASTAPPQLSKVTAFEFMQAWNGLKGTTDIEQYVNVLDQIQPDDIPKGMSILCNFSDDICICVLCAYHCH